MDGSQWFAYDRSGRILAIADGGELLVHDGPTEAPRQGACIKWLEIS
jgi:hypothetical protein